MKPHADGRKPVRLATRLTALALTGLLAGGLTLTTGTAWADDTTPTDTTIQTPATGDTTPTDPQDDAPATPDGDTAGTDPTQDTAGEGQPGQDPQGTDTTTADDGQQPADPQDDADTQSADTPSIAALMARETTASNLPVHKFDLEKVPAAYGNFKFSTQKVNRSQITIPSGQENNWKVLDDPDPMMLGVHWRPQAKGATLLITNAGRWADTATNTTRTIDAKVTVNSWYEAGLRLDKNGALYVQGGYWGTQQENNNTMNQSDGNMDFTVTFLDHATGQPVPSTFKGITGFGDLDGQAATPDNPIEGYELVSGFDTAWIRSDTHLIAYGTNGWGGGRDDNPNGNMYSTHAMQHYLGATFAGSTIRIRSNNHGDNYFGTYFQPMDNIMDPTYKLAYDANGGNGTLPQDAGCPTDYGKGATATLATAAADTDCWDSSKLTKQGATFLGWSTRKVGDITTPDQQAGAGITDKVTFGTQDITVWAVWATMPTLNYDTNIPAEYTGTNRPDTPGSTTVEWNTPVKDTSGWTTGDTGKLKGWKFDGWSATKDQEDWYWAGDRNPILTTSTTVHAHWTRLSANIRYDANGGQGSHDATQGWQYADTKIPDDASASFHRALHRFAGWNTKPDGTGTTWNDGGTITLQDKDITLYAQWKGVAATLPTTGGTPAGAWTWILPTVLATTGLAGAAWTLLRHNRRNNMRHGE